VQPRVAGQSRIAQQLALQLKSRLLRREQNQWRAAGIVQQRSTYFFKTQESLSRAGGTEKKSCLHGSFFA
jgi:hypothetical protein